MAPRLRRVRLPGLAALLASVMLATAVSRPLAAQQQTLQQLVDARRLDYEAAKKVWEAANLLFKNVDRQFDAALIQFSAARQSGNKEAIDRAFAEAQTRSVADAEQRRRVTDLAAKMSAARKKLVSAISSRLAELLAQMDSASTLQKRQALNATFTDLNNELKSLDQEADTVRLTPVVLPDITYDPRDTSQELEEKAEILDRRADIVDTLIGETQERIRQLRKRQSLERQRRDFMAGTGRFGDTHPPVLAGGTGGGDESIANADSTGVNAQPVTLQQRINTLQVYVNRLKDDRDKLLMRATQFRSHVRMVT